MPIVCDHATVITLAIATLLFASPTSFSANAKTVESSSLGRRVQWSSTKSKEPDCSKWPQKPLHGTYRWIDANSIEYLCRQGYSLLGNTYNECVGGRWSSSPPTCLGGECPSMITSLRHGTLVISLHRTLVKFVCRPGFTLSGASDTLACVDGQWNGTRPDCIPVKSYGRSLSIGTAEVLQRRNAISATALVHRPRRTHASGNGESNRIKSHNRGGGNVQHQRTNFPYRGALATSRAHDELLSEADYTCVSATKPVPPPTVAGALTSMRWQMLENQPRLYAVYRCNMDHVMGGSDESVNLYCRRGKWIGDIPVCIPLFDGDNDTPNDGIGHQGRTLPAYMFCLSQSPLGERLGLAHPQVVTPPDVDRTRWSYQYDFLDDKPRVYVKYTCTGGLVMKKAANERLYCINGSWIGVRPACVPVSCRINNGGCGHLCYDVATTKSGIRCACRHGYELDDDQRTCRDVDECAVNNAECDHLCDNTDGSFHCSCYPGFQLHPDQRTCGYQSF